MACSINISRQVDNTSLAKTKALWPVFEAISNSLFAINEKRKTLNVVSKNGEDAITVRILRVPPKNGFTSADFPEEIVGFEIEDTGIGFTENHLRAFKEVSSDFKKELGGKGLGRLSWLKVFQKAEIESTWSENELLHHRSFSFIKSREGVHDEKILQHGFTEKTGTRVRLVNILPDYLDNIRKRTATLSKKIIDHFLPILLSKAYDNIDFYIKDDHETIDLRKILETSIFILHESDFTVLSERLKIRVFRYETTDPQAVHEIRYFGEEREVKSIRLKADIPWLPIRISGGVYSICIEGKILDGHLNDSRTDFNFPDEIEDQELELQIISFRMIHATALAKFCELEGKEMDAHRVELEKNISAVIANEMPEFRPLISLLREYPEFTPSSLTTDSVYDAFSRLEAHVRSLRRKDFSKSREKLRSSDKREEILQLAHKCMENLDASHAFDLAKHVAFRKSFIEVFHELLGMQQTGKFATEDIIHELICPRYTSSNSPNFQLNNLWIIDEALVFHDMLTSDLGREGKKRVKGDSVPDIAIALGEREEERTSHVVIIDFKRPQKALSGQIESPVDQLQRYIKAIIAGEVKNEKKVPIRVKDNARFTCYLICSLDAEMREELKDRGFRPAMVHDGLVWINSERPHYFEIIDYEGMVLLARKRNRILFQKLGIE